FRPRGNPWHFKDYLYFLSSLSSPWRVRMKREAILLFNCMIFPAHFCWRLCACIMWFMKSAMTSAGPDSRTFWRFTAQVEAILSEALRFFSLSESHRTMFRLQEV